MVIELSELAPPKGARKNRKRIGRGNASGQGKTSGKGHKGQKARAGGTVPAYFEGGQMPLYRRIGKIGFRSVKKRLGINQFTLVPLHALDRFEDGATINSAALAEKGFRPRACQKGGYKILGDGEISKKLVLQVQAISASARAKIEAAGGTVEIV